MNNLQTFKEQLENLKKETKEILLKWSNSTKENQINSIVLFMCYANKNFQYHLAHVAAFANSTKNKELALKNLHDEIGGNHPRLGQEFCKALGIISMIYDIPSEYLSILGGLDKGIEDA